MKEIIESFKKFLRTFHVKREEAAAALTVLAIFVTLNVMVIHKYFALFSKTGQPVWALFVGNFRVSGYDPITYSVLSNWGPMYNVYRHPLLAYFDYPFYLLNTWLMDVFDKNLVQIVVLVPMLFFVFYSYIFIYRIVREIIGLGRFDATLLAFLTFSFAYVMVAFLVPDHFALSMFMLVLCLYVCGKCMQKGRQMKIWQTWAIFLFTAGTTLSNGIKIFIDVLFVNKRKFFRPKFFLMGIIAPSLLIWGFAQWEQKTYVMPRTKAGKLKQLEKGEKERKKLLVLFKDTTHIKDSAQQMRLFDRQMQQLKHQRWLEGRKVAGVAHKGKPMGKGEFAQWTDESTPRWDSAVENLFGESIQLHKDYLLLDTLRDRPVIVRYRHMLPYIVEFLIVVLFACGIWCGRRSRFFWMCFCGFLFDMSIHMVLGFGLNEVYIMGAHWLFIIPIAIAFLMKGMKDRTLLCVRGLTVLITVYLYVYNILLLATYFTSFSI